MPGSNAIRVFWEIFHAWGEPTDCRILRTQYQWCGAFPFSVQRAYTVWWFSRTLQWRHNEHDGVSNHKPHGWLLNRLFRRRSKKRSKLRVTGLCEGNSPVTGEFPTQRASNMENVSIWWRHHDGGNSESSRAYKKFSLQFFIWNIYSDTTSHIDHTLTCCGPAKP